MMHPARQAYVEEDDPEVSYVFARLVHQRCSYGTSEES